jgi:hypothetical protein
MATTEKDRERKIQARAKRLWRAGGAPKGRLSDYIERARELVEIEEHPAAALLPNPMTQHHGETPGAEPRRGGCDHRESRPVPRSANRPGRSRSGSDDQEEGASVVARHLRRGDRTINA